MIKRVQITLALLLVVLAGVSGWQGHRLREPIYQGKRLGIWLDAYRIHGVAGVESWQVQVAQQEADEAVRHAGTNALPTLLEMLRAKDSALKVKLMDLARRQHFIRIQYTPAEELNYQACCAFGVLRGRAQSAVTALINIANQDISCASGWYAVEALALVGPPAPEAIPLLFGWATNADSSLRLYAVNALAGIRDRAGGALPVLLSALHDPDDDPQIRNAALRALQGLGPNARPALPVLVEFLRTAPGGLEKSNAAAALKAIDPEAAAKAGVK